MTKKSLIIGLLLLSSYGIQTAQPSQEAAKMTNELIENMAAQNVLREQARQLVGNLKNRGKLLNFPDLDIAKIFPNISKDLETTTPAVTAVIPQIAPTATQNSGDSRVVSLAGIREVGRYLDSAAYYTAFGLPLYYIAQQVYQIYNSEACHYDRLSVIPDIENAKNVKVVITINEITIPIIKQKDGKYQSKNSNSTFNTVCDALNDTLKNSTNVNINIANNINIKVTVDTRTYSLTNNDTQIILINNGNSDRNTKIEELMTNYLREKLDLPKSLTPSNLVGDLKVASYSLTIYQEQSYMHILRKLAVAGIYTGFLSQGYYKAALASLGMSLKANAYFKDENKKIKKLVTLTASSLDDLKKEFSQWVVSNITQEGCYHIMVSNNLEKRVNSTNQCFYYRSSEDPVIISINPKNTTLAEEQEKKESKNNGSSTNGAGDSGSQSQIINDPYNQTTDIEELMQSISAGYAWITNKIKVKSEKMISHIPTFSKPSQDSTAAHVARYIFDNQLASRFLSQPQQQPQP